MYILMSNLNPFLLFTTDICILSPHPGIVISPSKHTGKIILLITLCIAIATVYAFIISICCYLLYDRYLHLAYKALSEVRGMT